MKRRIILIITLFIQLTLPVCAASYKVIKLLHVCALEKNPQHQAELYIDIANEMKGSNPDSALYYFSLAEKRSTHLAGAREKEVIRVKILIGRASVEIARGNLDLAWALDSAALIVSQKIKSPELEAATLMSRGSIYYNRSIFDEAQKCNREALRLIRTTKDRKTEGKILTNMGTIEFMFGNSNKADSLFRIPLMLAESTGDDDLLAAGLLNIGLLNVYSGKYQAAEEYIRKAVNIYEKIDGKDGLVLCYQNLANIWVAQGNIEKAIEYNMMNHNLSLELGDKTGLSKAYQNLGECYSQIGDHEMAIEYFIKALKIKTELGDTKEIAITNSSIGHMIYLQGDLNRALEYYRKSLQDYEQIGYMIGKAAGYGDIGNILAERNEGDSALYYFNKAGEMYARNEQPDYMANIYLNIGKVYVAQNRYDKADLFYKKAELIKAGLGDKIGLYNVQSLFAAMHYRKSTGNSPSSAKRKADLDLALSYALEAFELADSMTYLPGKKESAGFLMDIYSGLGNVGKSLKYARIKMEISDSLSKKQRAEALVNAEIRWKAERKQVEINRLEQQKALQLKIIEQQSALTGRLVFLIVATVVVLLLLVVVGFLYTKSKAHQKDIDYQKHLNEIAALKMQNLSNRFSPHLFFNLLGSVSGDAGDPEKVKQQVSQVAQLLRMSLEHAEHTAVSLSDELDMVKSYVELQRSRIPQPFFTDYEVGDDVNKNTPIPSMILQIPVENAIRHGLMPLEGEKNLKVLIRKVENAMEITIEDNGIGREKSKGRTTGTGTGLKVLLQTIRLLNQQNNEQITFRVIDGERCGTIVRIGIPDNYNYQLKTA